MPHTYNQKNSLIRIVDATINTETIYEDYVYDNQNKLISGTITMGGKVLWNLTYQKTEDKLIQNSISYDAKSINTNTFTFDDKGNLLKIEHVMNGDPVGGRWFFSDTIGVFAELGHGISTLNVGIAVKL